MAGTVAAKVKHLFGLCKEFEEKVWKWRRFLTDVGCGRYKMRHLQTKVGHLHTKGHGERYVGSLFRVDEPVPDDSIGSISTIIDSFAVILYEKLMIGCYPYIHTFTVMDRVASAQRPTTAHRNERDL